MHPLRVADVIRLRPGALSRACARLGLSRESLAREMGVSASTLFRVDRGDSAPSNRVIGLLIESTGASFDQLFEVVGGRPDDRRPGQDDARRS